MGIEMSGGATKKHVQHTVQNGSLAGSFAKLLAGSLNLI
jgi:hypothetical protein